MGKLSLDDRSAKTVNDDDDDDDQWWLNLNLGENEAC